MTTERKEKSCTKSSGEHILPYKLRGVELEDTEEERNLLGPPG